jgi:hypothetical protein
MLKTLANDTINDICLLQTSHRGMVPNFHVRYGLQIKDYMDINGALKGFAQCQAHALTCQGMKVE